MAEAPADEARDGHIGEATDSAGARNGRERSEKCSIATQKIVGLAKWHEVVVEEADTSLVLLLRRVWHALLEAL